MTSASFFAPSLWPRSIWISVLIVVGVLLSSAFHCGFPLAAFTAVAIVTLNRRDALLLSGGVWLANQTVVLASSHHPATTDTLAWSAALGAIALLSCEGAGLVARRMQGFGGACAGFLAAFFAYKGMIFGFGAAIGSSAGHLDSLLATLPRAFLINICVLAGLAGLYALGSAAARHHDEAFLRIPRHA
jgi:hypothetical protein